MERIFYLRVAEYWSRLLRKVAWIRHQASGLSKFRKHLENALRTVM